ncbi:hypothetical protein WJX73_010239 [Symbiochloris irregularis]|uniref:SMP-LTD domain-containing protein n=1 Tax=Symbiochloris irregularis TaxID=706552 RepID=A0AAW1Q3T9_9CHLO
MTTQSESQGTESSLTNPPLQRWTYLALGGAASAYVISCLPDLMRPTSALSALLLFVSGMTLGVVALALLGVYLFVKFATMQQPAQTGWGQRAVTATPDDLGHPELDGLDPTQRQALYEAVVKEMIREGATDVPPHPCAVEGKYAGWLWAMPGSRYDRTEALANWPPATDGPRSLATRWWAHIQGHSLLLVRTSQLEHDDKVPVVCVDLSGCSVQIVIEGLRGKTRWWRKAPLELSHPTRALLGNERSLMLFAAGSAAKEQWFTVLGRGAGIDGGVAAAAEELYGKFCSSVREGNPSDLYPQLADTAEGTYDLYTPDAKPLEGGSPSKGGSSRGRGAWKWWGKGKGSNSGSANRSREATPERRRDRAEGLKEKRSGARDRSPKRQQKLPPSDHPLPGFLSPQEMETAWMGKTKQTDFASRSLAKPTSQRSALPAELQDLGRVQIGRPALPELDSAGGLSLAGVLPEESGKALTAASTSQQQLPTTHKQEVLPSKQMHAPSISMPAMRGATEGQEPRPGGAPAPSASFLEDVHASRSSPVKQRPEMQYTESVARVSPDKQAAAGDAHASTAGKGWLGTEVAVNMLLTRIAFDLLRSDAFRDKVKAHIQRKINELRLPEFIHSIDCLDIDLGSAVPHIANLRALPTPDALIWPQVMFDLAYEGAVKVTIETKLHVRDHAMWSQLDQAITRVAGAVDESSSPPDSDDESAEPSGMRAAGTRKDKQASEDPSLKPLEPTPSASLPASLPGGTGAAVQQQPAATRRKLMDIQGMRRRFAEGIRQIAEVTADRITRMQLRLQLEVTSIKGPIVAWVPPPPGDRLWFSFVSPPELVADARPLVSGRMLKYVAQAGRVSQFIASKLQSSITKNMLFPSSSDIKLPHLLPADDPAAALALPTFLAAISGDKSLSAKASPSPATASAGQSKPAEAAATAQPPRRPRGLKLAGMAASWRDHAHERMRSAMQPKDPSAAGPQAPADKPAAKQA